MTSFVIILTCGIFALMAVIGLIDLMVHLVCWSARSLRTPGVLKDYRAEAGEGPRHGIAA